MDIPDFKVSLVCLFCGSVLKGPEDAKYLAGDLIKCAQCDEENDYESALEVAKEKGMEQMKTAVQDHLQKQFKDMFKKIS